MTGHLAVTVEMSGRAAHYSSCRCGWSGLARFGPNSDTLADADGDAHEAYEAHVAAAR